MKRLLAIELQKVWKNRSSRIITISYFVLLSMIALIATFKISLGRFQIKFADEGIFNFPFIWHFNSFIAIYGKPFLGIIIVSMISNEYSYGTLKQNLIDGMTKKEFILSKFYTSVLFALVSTTFVFIVSLILGLIYSSYNEIGIIFSEMEYLFAYFISLVCFSCMCIFIGILVKRSAFALGFIGLWLILECILVYSGLGFPKELKGFLPMEAMSRLLIEPFTKLSTVRTVGQLAGVKEVRDYAVHFSTVMIVLAWTAVFIFSSYKLIEKRDL